MRNPVAVIVSVPQPCGGDWNAMMPVQGGRHCASCQKMVTDFTAWKDAAIAAFFLKPENAAACGRFRTSQLNRPLHLPHQPHSLLYRWVMAAGIAAIALTPVSASAQIRHNPAPLVPMPPAVAPVSDTAGRLPDIPHRAPEELERVPVRSAADVMQTVAGTGRPSICGGHDLVIGGSGIEMVIIIDGILLPRPPDPLDPAAPQPHGTRTFTGDELDRKHLLNLDELTK